MKKNYFLILFILSVSLGVFAQVQINQSFTSPFNLSANGWYRQNNSHPLGTGNWSQGLGYYIPANSG